MKLAWFKSAFTNLRFTYNESIFVNSSGSLPSHSCLYYSIPSTYRQNLAKDNKIVDSLPRSPKLHHLYFYRHRVYKIIGIGKCGENILFEYPQLWEMDRINVKLLTEIILSFVLKGLFVGLVWLGCNLLLVSHCYCWPFCKKLIRKNTRQIFIPYCCATLHILKIIFRENTGHKLRMSLSVVRKNGFYPRITLSNKASKRTTHWCLW